MKKIYIILLFMFTIVACDHDFLDVLPDINNSTEITRVSDLDALVNGIKAPYISDFVNVWATDNAYMPQAVLDESTSFSNELQGVYKFETELDRSADRKWQYHYRNILLPNVILEGLDNPEVTGDDTVLRAELRAEAHFNRAFHLFELATVYSLHPKIAGENDLGIVLKKTTSLTESLKRATVKETFDFILADLEEALKYPTIEKRNIYRIGKPSVHALAARVHLYLGDYDMAKTHADEALNGHNAMVNFEEELYILDYSLWYGDFVYPNTAAQSSYGGLSIPDFWVDQYYFVRHENGHWNTSPSQELVDLYDETDLRNMFFIEGWFSRSGVSTDTWKIYMNTAVGVTLQGPGVPEMYLTRAECKARNNDIAGAMADVEMVRTNRFNAVDYVPLAIPTSSKDAVQLIIDERRREDPFEYRFMDIKRLNTDDLTDPIIITRSINGETISIQPTDRRYARPIGQDVIELSDGVTAQNEY